MARLVTSGFEFAHNGSDSLLGPDGKGSSTNTWDTVLVRSGARSLKCPDGATGCRWTLPAVGSTGVNYYLRTYIRFDSLPAFDWPFTMYIEGGATFDVLAKVQVRTTGELYLDAQTGTGTYTSTASGDFLSVDTWYMLELRVFQSTTAGADEAEIRLDGTSVVSWTGTFNFTGAPSAFQVGQSSGTVGKSIWFDDVAFNDANGASQNSWPGQGKVIAIRPVSDNARGTNWTTDAAGTTNLWDAMNGAPPVGATDTTVGPGTNNIRNASSTANSNMDVNLTDYATAGLTAADTITCVVPWVNTAAPVSTSAKQGTVGVVSNPAITNVALSATGTAGAFWSGVAASTWGTGWKWSPGTVTYAPSVTLGTQPVMRITQVTSNTRIAMVDAMGLYIEYVPGSTYVPRAPGVDSGNAYL